MIVFSALRLSRGHSTSTLTISLCLMLRLIADLIWSLMFIGGFWFLVSARAGVARACSPLDCQGRDGAGQSMRASRTKHGASIGRGAPTIAHGIFPSPIALKHRMLSPSSGICECRRRFRAARKKRMKYFIGLAGEGGVNSGNHGRDSRAQIALCDVAAPEHVGDPAPIGRHLVE